MKGPAINRSELDEAKKALESMEKALVDVKEGGLFDETDEEKSTLVIQPGATMIRLSPRIHDGSDAVQEVTSMLPGFEYVRTADGVRKPVKIKGITFMFVQDVHGVLFLVEASALFNPSEVIEPSVKALLIAMVDDRNGKGNQWKGVCEDASLNNHQNITAAVWKQTVQSAKDMYLLDAYRSDYYDKPSVALSRKAIGFLKSIGKEAEYML